MWKGLRQYSKKILKSWNDLSAVKMECGNNPVNNVKDAEDLKHGAQLVKLGILFFPFLWKHPGGRGELSESS